MDTYDLDAILHDLTRINEELTPAQAELAHIDTDFPQN